MYLYNSIKNRPHVIGIYTFRKLSTGAKKRNVSGTIRITCTSKDAALNSTWQTQKRVLHCITATDPHFYFTRNGKELKAPLFVLIATLENYAIYYSRSNDVWIIRTKNYAKNVVPLWFDYWLFVSSEPAFRKGISRRVLSSFFFVMFRSQL